MDMINDWVDPNPKIIKTLFHLENVISLLNHYSKKCKCNAVVVNTQNNQFGSVYNIFSEKKAKYFKEHPTSERVLNIYDISFYENMREKFTKKEECKELTSLL